MAKNRPSTKRDVGGQSDKGEKSGPGNQAMPATGGKTPKGSGGKK